MKSKFSSMFLNRKFNAIKIFMLFMFVAFVMVFVPSCDENNGGGTIGVPTHAFILCDHRNEALEDLQQVMDIAVHNRQDNFHIMLDGINLGSCTQQDITLIREAFDAGFIILAYEMNEARIAVLYKEILNHPLIFDEFEQLNIPAGEEFSVFTIENRGGHDWSSQIDFGSDEITTSGRIIGENQTANASSQTRQDETSGGFINHGNHMVDWIEDFDERLAELIDDGLVGGSATQVLNNFEMMDDIEKELEAVTNQADITGTILGLASAWIQTNFLKVYVESDNSILVQGSDSNAPHINIYQMTTKAWVATTGTQTGTISVLCVNQDYGLASTNGFVENDVDSHNAWFLSEFKNINTLKIGSTDLDTTNATLDPTEQPATNQASTATTTVSVNASLSGTVGVDQDGASASVSAGVDWGTFSLADL